MVATDSTSARPPVALESARAKRGKAVVERMARSAGIEIDGTGPAGVRILDSRVYDVALARGFTGLREAYVEGWLEAEQLDVVTDRLLSCDTGALISSRVELALRHAVARLLNRQTRTRSLAVRRHYDLGNDLYGAMLDGRMVYSCAYWRQARSLDEAQEAKLDLVCRKLHLERGMRMLDIGCGWGSLARFAAERYGVSVVGLTLSAEQAKLAREVCAGLPVEIRVLDYRDLCAEARYDRIASLGMFEHVGYKNYRRYMKIARDNLAVDGLFLLHTIGGNESQRSYDPWMDANIFPNAQLPSAAQITRACEGVLVVEDWHNIGPDYDPTLMAWFGNFHARWPALRDKYGDRFYRMWKCYLLTCAGSFRARRNHVWQIMLSPRGVRGGYTPIR